MGTHSQSQSQSTSCCELMESIFKWSLILIMLVILIALTVDLFTTRASVAFLIDVVKDIESYDAWTIAMVLMTTTCIGVIINFPSTFLAVCSGFLMVEKEGMYWGVVWSALINITGYVIGAIVCYGLAISILKSWIVSMTEQSTVLKRISYALARKDFELNVLIRLSPIVPAVAINYGLPTLGSKLYPYVVGCFLGTLPYSILFSIVGGWAGNADSIKDEYDDMPAWLSYSLLGVGVTVLVMAAYLGYKYSSEALNDMLEKEAGEEGSSYPSESDSLLPRHRKV